jgi:probable H4MPT-linked C1 transfer pathway protein
MLAGLDIGGANLKVACPDGTARLRPFALWKDPGGLTAALRALVAELPPVDGFAVTMTGELCDCFDTKRHGVAALLDAVELVAAGRPVQVWRTDGQFVTPAEARATPLQTAAANWRALATYAGRLALEGPALLIDVGSTTTDVIPLLDGRPVPTALTDPERLRSGELVYTGARRTPLCALLGGEAAAELFATTLDVWLLLGAIPEDPADRDTADGRPATRACAHARLARMLCADPETCTPDQTRRLAERALLKQVHLLTGALRHLAERLPAPARAVILAGSGERLAGVALREQHDFPVPPVISLAERLGPEVSQAACAYALAVLASERAHERR